MASRAARTSSTIGSDVKGMLLFLLKFQRGADNRWIIACGTAEAIDLAALPCVRDVGTVPGEQVVEPMNGGDGDGERVSRRFDRKTASFEEVAAKGNGVLCRVEQDRFPQCVQPQRRCIGIASARLVQNQLRDE